MGFLLVRSDEDVNDADTSIRIAQRLWDEFELRHGIQTWRLTLQDSWLLSYMVFDASQSSGPPNRERYYSPRISSIVDTARRVLTRNPIRYHLLSQHFKADDRSQREPLRRLENVLHGVQYDIDRQLVGRGELRARQQAAFGGLVRGAWAYKYHLTRAYKSATGSPQQYIALDSRQVLPIFDSRDLQSAIAFTATTLNTLLGDYDDTVRPKIEEYIRILGARGAKNVNYAFAHQSLTMLEYSSREEHAVLVDLSGLPEELTRLLRIDKTERHQKDRWLWLELPYKHGFGRSLIRYGNVNGVPTGLGKQDLQNTQSPMMAGGVPLHTGGDTTTGTVRNQIFRPTNDGTVFGSASGAGKLIDTGAPLAGRSIFAMIQHLIPEFNSFVALMKQATVAEVRGTWTFQSQDGQMIPLEIGTGSVNPMTLRQILSKIDTKVGSIDMMSILQVINQEIADGSPDLRFVLAAESEGSGFLRSRLEQAALIATEDYKDGVETWSIDLAESFITQFRAARKGSFKKWQIVGREPGQSTSFFVVDIDDDVIAALKDAKEPPVIEATVKSAMPIDMMARINMAKAAIDPNNPIMSLSMALDIIMEFDDADAAYDSILTDIGRRNPTIVLLEISQAFERAGAGEIATMIMKDEFRAAFSQSKVNQQGATTTPAGSTPGIRPGTTPPEITSGGGTEPSQNVVQTREADNARS